ncbi:MAG TPA: hypothetical protein VNY05_07780 [Candidatus Acidoferrales bacterium]|nr:hypothetical protein [Candidatus Acidoferrales bacterium]
MEEINDEMSDNQQVLEFGIMLGQRRAFGWSRAAAARRRPSAFARFATGKPT